MTFLRSFLTAPGLLRLLSVRLGSQVTDGVFQAALGGAILFNPERHSDPLAVAGGLAVLLLPYSVIGPFAGALLDHWARRTVLIWANVFRALAMIAVAIAIATGGGDVVVLLLALVVTGASRFVASGLSAALPHVIDRDRLVGTNAFFTTAGTIALAVGAGIAVGLRAIFGSDNVGSALTLSSGVVLALAASAIAHGFDRFRLGPDEPDEASRTAVHAVAVGLLHGADTVRRTPSVLGALSAIGMHRIVFGINTLMVLVLTKHSSLGGGGLVGVSMVGGFIAAGLFLAAVITPFSVSRIGRRQTLLLALALGAVAELGVTTLNAVVICVSAVVLGLIGQMAKLCGDAAMQLDVDDTHRGQVFAFQDALFNVAYVAAISYAAVTIADDGRSPSLAFLGAALYVVGMVAVMAIGRRSAASTPPTDGPASRGPIVQVRR